MNSAIGLRQRKKAQTRELLADTAARLFATRGYDQVAIVDVARAANVSDQTVYNYFPAKHDLVLDRADEFRARHSRAVLERESGTSPAAALRLLAHEDVERYRSTDLDLARGEFPALGVSSATIRRFALEIFDQQSETVAAAIQETNPAVHTSIVRAHATALISVFQMITDRIGRAVLEGAAPDPTADELAIAVEVVLADLDRHFLSLTGACPLPR